MWNIPFYNEEMFNFAGIKLGRFLGQVIHQSERPNEMFSIQAAQSDKWKYIPSITLKNYLYTDIVIKQEH